ncbi:MAG: NAD(+) synthase [Clostridia bacterium]|nr:NAD(+) synthase [Clostridia bacterium]
MQNGFIKVKALSLAVRLNDVSANAAQIVSAVLQAEEEGVSLLVTQELSLTGATVGDMAAHTALLAKAESELLALANATKETSVLFFVGLPVKAGGAVFNVAAGVCGGKILGFVPKNSHASFGVRAGEKQFACGNYAPKTVLFGGEEVPMGNITFTAKNMPAFSVTAAVGQDAFFMNAPVLNAFADGANILAILNAEEEGVEKESRLITALKYLTQTYKVCAVYAEAGNGESVSDGVFGGRTAIYENGEVLAESNPFSCGVSVSEADTTALSFGKNSIPTERITQVFFTARVRRVALSRKLAKLPFLPNFGEEQAYTDYVLTLQAQALAKRVAFTRAKRMVLGLSGGLDSTLALIVCAKAADILGVDRKAVLCVTMPCFGTTNRTYENAVALALGFGAELKEIPIKEAVQVHLKDIGHPLAQTDVTYENAQARERTQVLMDLANHEGGLVVGTGDLSELALGWATYNGDHMSNYAVNVSIPKTLVRLLVKTYALSETEEVRARLFDVLDTPVSPELLPVKGKENDQKTEDIVGPYELHDFFLHAFMKRGYTPETTLRVAEYVFQGEYEKETVRKWLKVFLRRFFSQQFKRSCLPEGVSVGTVGVSPRGFLTLPGDGLSISLEEKE